MGVERLAAISIAAEAAAVAEAATGTHGTAQFDAGCRQIGVNLWP